MRSRVVVPEILDSLPVADPEAIVSRRQLRRLNGVMGNFTWVARTLEPEYCGQESVLELGAGDGQLAMLLAEKLPALRGAYTALDRVPPPPDWPAALTWLQADIWSPEGQQAIRAAGVVIANLVLHHFTDAELERLGAALENARLLLFNEPARRRRHLWQGRLIYCLLNRVTRHDLPVSVRAGFRHDELPARLGLSPKNWQWQAHATFLGAYRCLARADAGGVPGRRLSRELDTPGS